LTRLQPKECLPKTGEQREPDYVSGPLPGKTAIGLCGEADILARSSLRSRIFAFGRGNLAKNSANAIPESENYEMLPHSDRRSPIRNTILSSLLAPDLAAVAPFLRAAVLRGSMVLHEPRKPIDRVYFIESGLVSLRVVTPDSTVETAVADYRSAVGLSCLLGFHTPIYQSAVVFAGNEFRAPTSRPKARQRQAKANYRATTTPRGTLSRNFNVAD
jgi:hypothetical protein